MSDRKQTSKHWNEPMTGRNRDVGIQVDDFDILFETLNQNDDSECGETQEQQDAAYILEYFKTNTEIYENGITECLQCGEVASSQSEMELHMAMHRGPKTLCAECGLTVDHEVLVKHHKCPRPKQGAKFLYCPLYRCTARAISKLELYDHINEHTQTRQYHCKYCSKQFSTIGEYLSHFPMRLSCLEKLKNHILPYPKWSKVRDATYRDRFQVHQASNKVYVVKRPLQYYDCFHIIQKCLFCFRRFTNINIYRRHRRKCLKKHERHLELKRKALAANII